MERQNKNIRFAPKEEVESFFDAEWESFSDAEKEIVKEQLLEVFYGRSINDDLNKKLFGYVKRKTEFLNK